MTLLLFGAWVTAVAAVPAAPALNPPVVAGPRITLSWGAVPGALGYRLAIGRQLGVEEYAHVVGPVTSVSFDSPFVGTAFVWAQAFDVTGLSTPSNPIVLTVTTLTPVPAAPVNLQAFLSGQTVGLTWAAGAGGGPPLGVMLEVGSGPGLADFGTVPLALSTSLGVPGVPPGTYFVRVYGVNGSGRSAASNEVRVDMPLGGGCTTPPAPSLSVNVTGTTVAFGWADTGAAGYRLDVASGPAGPIVASQVLPGGQTSISFPGAPAGTYYARLMSLASCGAEASSEVITLTVSGGGGGGGGGNRTPNPPPGQRLPLPNMTSIVNAVGSAYPADLRNSCVEHGGNNAWLYRLVQELRRYDTRWGLNWKRGNRGDMSQDVINYNFGSEPDEGTTNVYIIDVIVSHCGANPQPAWIDQTEVTRQGGTIGRWTLQPYIAAGGTP